MSQPTNWEISGADDQPIFGTAYTPAEAALGCAIIAHGFKGYKDFRMIPPIARALCEAGFVAHAFNFSHSGMAQNPDSFERPDLFELDTWNKQVYDIGCIVEAIANGQLAGAEIPYILVGHSRGGVTAILFAGRNADRPRLPRPAGIITAGTPDHACGLSEIQKDKLRTAGGLESPSARTGQVLRVGLQWLTEQESDASGHDLLLNAAQVRCPILVVHGESDETVNVECSASIARAATNARVVRIGNCNHVFNAPNPPPTDIDAIPELDEFTREIVAFSAACCKTP